MFVECPKCTHRLGTSGTKELIEISCSCGEKPAFIPSLSYRQNITEPGIALCSICKQTYDTKKYRDNTEIGCSVILRNKEERKLIFQSIAGPESSEIKRVVLYACKYLLGTGFKLKK